MRGATSGGLIEIHGTAGAEALEAARAEVEALVVSAGEKGAHAELALFPLQGDIACRVWSARRHTLVDFPPEAREVQADYRFVQRGLREAATRASARKRPDPELERRTRLLEAARQWPGLYPVSGEARHFRDWLERITDSAGAEARPVLERLGREHSEALLELSRRAQASDPGWSAAARAAGLEPGDLHPCGASLALPVILTSPAWRKQLGLKGLELLLAMRALGRIAPDLLPGNHRRQLLAEARYEAERSSWAVGPWFETARRLEGRPLVESMREALQRGARPEAAGKQAGFAWFAQQVVGWSVEPAALPELRPLGDSEVRAALEELARAGLPARLEQRIQAAREATPPYGLEALPAWRLEPKRVARPLLECEECGAAMRPKAELRIPPLTEAHGARTVRVYECAECSREEPTGDTLRLTVEPAAPRNTPMPERFEDYPDAREVEQLPPPGFVARRYEDFLQRRGLKDGDTVQLGGYAHGVYGDDPLLGVRCRHAATLLQLPVVKLGLELRKVRVAAGVCLKAGCKRPGISDEVAMY